ncbi:MAG: SGNH/GDSL hydrolase family protein [Luteibacter sp.]
MHARIRSALALALAAMGLAGTSLAAETTTHLRCYYRLASDPVGAATGFIQPDDVLPGYWGGSSIMPSRSMFYTDVSPDTVRTACAAAVAKAPDAAGPAMIRVADGKHSYNHEIWFNKPGVAGQALERIVAFGDSLTDTGNMFNESQWRLPGTSWHAGHFTNGSTWVEYLSARSGLPLNTWAVGGAQAADVYFGALNGIGSQVDSFLEYAKQARDYDPSKTMFTFLIGGNDFVNDGKTGEDVARVEEAAIRRVIAAGARHVLLVTLPDLSSAPTFRMGRKDAGDVFKRVAIYNHELGRIARRLADETPAKVELLDGAARFNDVLAAPATFGFTNIVDSCLKIDVETATHYTTAHPVRSTCNPNTYLFWDTLHPTTRMHSLMAGWALEATSRAWGIRCPNEPKGICKAAR